MAYELWSQDNFTKGELSPYMYARASVNQYYNGLKTAQNVLTYPTGAAGKRFGTLFQAIEGNIPDVKSFFFQTFEYLGECVYQLVFYPLGIDIFLEGILIANISTLMQGPQVYNLINTVIGATFRVTGAGLVPMDLTRSDTFTATITAVVGNTFTYSGGTYGAGVPIPVHFFGTAGGGNYLPVTSPQIVPGVTYFAWTETTSSVTIYNSAYEAKFSLNPIILTNIGVGTNYIVLQNTWNFAATIFKNVPVYDFNGIATSYDALTFTPSAINGAAVTITVSGSGYSPLGAAYVGGAFVGGGGTSRITAVASATSFTVAVQIPFDSTDAILGSLVFLAEPAWSNVRGWPEKCSSYQNRSLFANSRSLCNGFWASVINDYSDFNDLDADDDSAISWYPSSDNVNFIRFIVPYRSITVHTNTGIYSSPLSDVAAITPSNFSLQLQDSTPADVLQPRAIDNQILVLSGNDCHTMLWDGINNAYTSDIVSVINEQTIREPVDETPYADLRRAGSRYIFIINTNGSMAIYQTLISQEVSGFTPHIMEQSYGSAQFRQAASSSDGRCWFITERDIATAQSGIDISGYTAATPTTPAMLTATSSNFSTTVPTAITFTTSGTLPTSSPQIIMVEYYWAMGVDANDFVVYLDQADALAGVNAISFTSAGSSSHVIPWTWVPTFVLEELTHEVQLDCAVYYTGTPVNTITTGSLFNAQSVKMVGDGFGFDAIGISNEVVFEAHGADVDVSEAYIGFPINLIIEPMPLAMSTGASQKNTSLTKPKHIRSIRFMFNNTIGGTINGVPIALNRFNQADIGYPPIPANGIFELETQTSWDDFNNPSYTIMHNEPFNIELLGVFYSVEV